MLSPEPLLALKNQNPQLVTDPDGMHWLIANGGDIFYVYGIDPSSFYITRMEQRTSSDTTFSADYYYYTHNGIPVLRMMAMNGDTSITGSGGYRFSNIRINGETNSRNTNRAKKRSRDVLQYTDTELIILLSNSAQPGSYYSIRDIRGALIEKNALKPGATSIRLPSPAAAGQYILEWNRGAGTKSALIPAFR